MKYFLIFFTSLLLISTGYAQRSQSFTSFDQHKIAYTDDGSGEIIFLLHGFISNGSSWQQTELKKQLLASGFRVIIPDLRGNGASDKPQDPATYADDAEIRDLMALGDHLSAMTFSVVGYSRGSIVLAKWLTKDPRISKAVIGGMGLDFTNPDWSRRIMFEKAFSGEEELNEITRGAVEYATSIGADLKIMSLLQEFQPVTSVAELEGIRIPVLVIAGNEDKDNGDPAALASHLPRGHLVIVSGDHNGTYRGAEFADEVTGFLSGR